MRKYFKGIPEKEADGWILAFCGNSNEDELRSWIIDTNSLHADQIPDGCSDAKMFSRLVSGLLNCFYNSIETKPLEEADLIRIGTVEVEENIPSPLNPELPF